MARHHVLQVIPSLALGGISSVVMNWYRALDRNLVQFDFISFNDGPLAQEITALGGRVFILPTFRQQPLNYMAAFRKILNNGTRYQAIHVHNSFKNVVMLWQAKLANVPVRVCHSHTAGLEARWLRPLFGVIKQLTRAASNQYVACGQEAGSFLFGQRRFEQLNNAIDVKKYNLPNLSDNSRKALYEKYQLPKHKHLVLHVGRFSKVKNHQFLLALAQDKNLYNDIHFVCVGDGPLKTEVAKQIESANLNQRFSLLASNNEIAKLMAIADAFIMPSVFEGVSVALLEAQASNLPCLVSNTVAKEVDMGMGSLKFLSLSEPNRWTEQLNLMTPKAADSKALACFSRHGYSIDEVVDKLIGIYQIQ
ncbi:glycosyltransferase [Thalassotalea euphylliae]|uniref:Glycosyltransferase family 1 protein n=1 Tax=Thalassotalea euphylliae TaxID=1655234 RepID=A0A3E0UJD1_9GAMM|nr:glycosyltransferase [Thalassotalea euphylliae]REL36976.1 glycosyltransferase family 1 protein [Thalassotalea euphylliae]